jgi:hypothetical protein
MSFAHAFDVHVVAILVLEQLYLTLLDLYPAPWCMYLGKVASRRNCILGITDDCSSGPAVIAQLYFK